MPSLFPKMDKVKLGRWNFLRVCYSKVGRSRFVVVGLVGTILTLS
jgi:hypothetical protein